MLDRFHDYLVTGIVLCVVIAATALSIPSSATNHNKLLQHRQFFASTVKGLENVLAKELQLLPDVSNIKIEKAGVSFTGTVKSGLSSLLWSRTALKLMELINETEKVQSKAHIKAFIDSINWCEYLTHDQSLKCECLLGENVAPELQHNHFTSLTVKNAIVDQFRSKFNRRPNVDIANPDISLFIYLHKKKMRLYRVWSGETSLHKRSYRTAASTTIIHKAALRETTAAALLLLTDWPNVCKTHLSINWKDYDNKNIQYASHLLIDPMCGSGTFLIEGALMACDTAPGLLRYGNDDVDKKSEKVAPLFWKDLEERAVPIWNELMTDARMRDKRHVWNDHLFCVGNDVNPHAITLAQNAAESAGVSKFIRWTHEDAATVSFSNIVTKNQQHKDVSRSPLDESVELTVSSLETEKDLIGNLFVVTNPPWDKRLTNANVSWVKLQHFLRNLQSNSTRINTNHVYILTGNELLLKNLAPSFVPEAAVYFSAANVPQAFFHFRIQP